MVVNESAKPNRSVRPKLKTNDSKIVVKSEKKHRLKQRFEVLKKLGQGTYGKVQLAINKETGQEVAIKTIKKSKVESEQDLVRIRREIQIMSSIQHPHIIHIYEVFENKDKIVLVMQYASGGEVYDYVSDRKVLNDSEARRLFRQIATAIYYCHKNKICHRDLKLENILLDEKGNAKIADFGLSNVFDERHYLQTFCGSPLYASPEIVKGLPYYGPEVDCWSLGVLLYTLVYGAMPFDGSNFKRLVKQITESNYFEPKQKSEASVLIKRLLTPEPSERASIIDICTDCWVNCGYEHSLLQVAEDMANLTPVRLEILLALAPVSPSAEKLRTNPFDVNEVENKASNENNIENMNNLEESANDVNSIDSSAKKRQANTSFDQSLSSIPTQTPKKKKPKKSQIDTKVIENKAKDNEMNGKTIVSESVQQNEVSVCDHKSSEPLQTSEQMPQKVEELKSDLSPNKDQIDDKSLKTDSLLTTSADNSCQLKESQELKSNANQEIELNSDQILKPIESENQNKQTEDEKTDNIRKGSEDRDNKINNKSDILDDNRIISESKPIEQNIELKSDQNQKTEEIEKQNETKIESKDEKKKVKRERSLSAKRPGKLSIPNLWNKSFDTTESQPSSDTRRDSQTSVCQSDRKAPFIPIGFRVSDAKRAFERRCSVPTNSLVHSVSTFNKRKDSKISEDSETKQTIIRQRAPKLNTRSMSCNEMLESPKRVQELNDSLMKRDNIVDNIDAIKELEQTIDESQTKVISERSSPLKEDRNELSASPVLDKDMAKDILKKSIAKAKLMEKRQTSNESLVSPTTTPLVSIENSDISILSEPTFFRKPRPYVKEESDKPVLNMKIDINVEPKITQNEETVNSLNMKSKTPSFERVISSELVPNSCQVDDNEKLDSSLLPEQTKATPIARSYKKVTFTKDGACVTETGKIYSSEGTDGSYTRVEKKSKVTHFPSIEDQTIQSTGHENSIQRSDSQSSSGSLDIFEDIFDNHWCGESIFPNMKSLLHGVVGNRKGRRRSRAESCERNASDWFGLRRNLSTQSDQESETDDYESNLSRSLWPTAKPHSSIFNTFSKHFSELDKDFGIFDDSSHPFRDMNRSVSRDRTSFSSRIHPTSFKVVFGPQTSVRSATDKSCDPFESNDNYGSASKGSLNNNLKTRFTDIPKMWSREPESMFSESSANLGKTDSFDASRKRVEQWLQSDNNEDNSEPFDMKTPFSKYATVGPRGVRRYLRTISGRSSNDRQNNDLFNSSSSVGGMGSQHSNAVHSTQSSTIPNDSVIEMRFSLNPLNIESNTNTNIVSNRQTNKVCEPSECSDDYQSSIVLPESSSLLEQLRTHGYRNIVSQRLSGSSLFSDLDSNLTENDTNYKRGKSVLNCSSGVINDNANACECMDETNPMVTTSATTSEAAIASHRNANNIKNDLKASDSLSFLNRVDFDSNSESLNHCLNHTVNQQSCESTSRSSENNSKSSVTDDLPKSNPILKCKLTSNNKNVNFKESVEERIHRKSFYSRFNDDRPVLSSRQRRRSFIDTEDIGLAFGSKLSSSLSSRSNSFRNSLSLDDHFVSSKPSSSSSEWFNRMESKASQLMDDLLVNDRMSSFHQHFKDRETPENGFSFGSRRRSSSSTRSTYSTPRSHKSDFDSYFTSVSNSLSNNNNNENKDQNDLNNLTDDLRSPTEVLRKAIDLLSEKD